MTHSSLSFRPDDPTVAARISGCLAEITYSSTWQDWASCLPCHSNFTAWLHDSVRFINNYPISFGQKSWCNLWWPAYLQRARCTTARSRRFALHNIRKIRPFLTEHAAQLLLQALVISRVVYCNALLAGLPSNTIKPLQMIQNAAARLVFNEPKRAHVTPLFLQLQIASSSRHWCLHIEQPQAQHPPTSTHYYESTFPPEFWDLLVSDASWCHHREAQNHTPEHSRSPFLAGGMIFVPTPIRNAGSLSIFKQQLKTHHFQHYLTFILKKKKR